MISKGRDIPADLSHLAQDIAHEGLTFAQSRCRGAGQGSGQMYGRSSGMSPNRGR